MPAPRKPAHVVRRKDRAGLWAYLGRGIGLVNLHTEDDAEAALGLATLLQSRRLPEVPKGAHPIAAIFAECHRRAVTNHAKKTAYEIGLNLDRVLAWLSSREPPIVDATHLSAQVVEDYKESRRFAPVRGGHGKVGAARINRELDNWKKATRIAIQRHALGADALEWFTHLREAQVKPHQRGLHKRQLRAFFGKAPPGFRDLFRLYLGAALRDEEAVHLDEADVKRASVTVNPKPPGWCECCPNGWTSKGYRYREIPATPATVQAARAFLRVRDELRLHDKKRTWNIVQATCEASKVPAFSLHDLRRAGASQWLADGVKLATISKWLGHRDIITTMRYLRIVEDEVKPSRLTW